MLPQQLIGGLAIYCRVVLAAHRTAADNGLALLGTDGTDAGGGGADQRALDDGGRAFFLQERNERLAHPEFGDDLGGIGLGIGAEGVGGRSDRLLIAWRIGAQRMLHTIAELPEHRVRYVERVLRDEIDADALGADEA